MDKREQSRLNEVRPDPEDERAISMMRAMEREREINIDNLMNPYDILYFPIEKVRYGWVYKWIRRSTLGVPDLNHERLQLVKGWTPVPADRHPEEARNYLNSSGIDDQANIIERQGLLLCEIPQSVLDKYNQKIYEVQESHMKSLAAAIEQMPKDPTVPAGVIANYDDYSPKVGTSFGYQ